jgi:RNA polymerase sigma-70 factor (ECF subfamily)
MIVGNADRRAARMSEAFRLNAPDILRYFDRRVPIAEDAADLMAETMLVAWRRNTRLPTEPEEARMWLFQIAKYTLLNYRRGRRRHIAATDILKHSIAHTPPPEEAKNLDDKEDVQQAIDSLPKDQAEIIRLVHWDGFSVAEVARLIGTAEPTVRGRYNRALARLRTHIDRPPDASPALPPIRERINPRSR